MEAPQRVPGLVGAHPRSASENDAPAEPGGTRALFTILPSLGEGCLRPGPHLPGSRVGKKGCISQTRGSLPAPIRDPSWLGPAVRSRQEAPRGQRPGASGAVVQGLCTARCSPQPALLTWPRAGEGLPQPGLPLPLRKETGRARQGRQGWGSWWGGRGESGEALSQHGCIARRPEPRTKTQLPLPHPCPMSSCRPPPPTCLTAGISTSLRDQLQPHLPLNRSCTIMHLPWVLWGMETWGILFKDQPRPLLRSGGYCRVSTSPGELIWGPGGETVGPTPIPLQPQRVGRTQGHWGRVAAVTGAWDFSPDRAWEALAPQCSWLPCPAPGMGASRGLPSGHP